MTSKTGNEDFTEDAPLFTDRKTRKSSIKLSSLAATENLAKTEKMNIRTWTLSLFAKLSTSVGWENDGFIPSGLPGH